MKKKSINIKYLILSLICVIIASVLAILVHALFPGSDASAVEDDFDSFPVKLLGFPIVASTYFVILYLQIFLVIRRYQKGSPLSKIKTGLRYGIAFGLIYLIGMQEVILSASPYPTYGIEFVTYELFMGLGDALPAFGLCLAISVMTRPLVEGGPSKKEIKKNLKRNIVIITLITTGFFLQRMIGYLAGYIESDIKSCPIPTVIWTIIFGLTFGFAYILLEPIYSKNKRGFHIIVLTLGVNWIWFNMFIGLIYKGMWAKMYLRGVMDILSIYIFYCITLWILPQNKFESLK